jgi:8-oxo-dGTP pyrophosphatase MutT (NUDIX family)
MAPDFDEARLASFLSAHPGRRAFARFQARRSAVAVVIDAQCRVLLIRRANIAGDRWSSQVSFPGGLQQDGDASLRDTAIRETREEVGLDLSSSPCLGSLDDARAIANGGWRLLSVSPYVFREAGNAPLIPGPEVSRAFWFPLREAVSGRLDSRWRQKILGIPFSFRAWAWEGDVVWGLTFEMIGRLLKAGS